MSGAPLPFPAPPTLERAVQEAVDIIQEVRDLRTTLTDVSLSLARLLNSRTEDRLLIGGLQKKLDGLDKRLVALEQKLDGISANLVKLLGHLGVVRDG
jgi:chromosome segregation ATPase